MTLLTVVQQHCRINTLAIPASVAGNLNTTVQQLFGLCNELVDEVNQQTNWQAFTYEALFSLTAAEDQGDIATLAPNGFQYMHNETFFDRTLRRPVYGPLTDVEWQQIKALPNPGPWYKYRIRRNRLLVNPVPTTPFSQVAFEYASSYGVKANDGTPKPYFTVDGDSFILPETILQKGLAYRWKQAKGMAYQADEERFWSLVNSYIAKDGSKRAFNMACTTPLSLEPGIFVPSGNWPF